MVDDGSRRLERSTLLLVAGIGSLAGLAGLAAITVSDPDVAASLAVSPHRVTAGTILAAALLVIGAITLPAYVLSGWQSAREEAARERGR